MKKIHTLAVLAISLVTPALIHAAGTRETAYVANAKRDPGFPVPVSVVAPSGYKAEAGDTAEVTLVVDADGKPTNVAVKSATDESLARAAKAAVKRWQFAPAVVDGKPTAVKVLVPFNVTDANDSRPAFAVNR